MGGWGECVCECVRVGVGGWVSELVGGGWVWGGGMRESVCVGGWVGVCVCETLNIYICT